MSQDRSRPPRQFHIETPRLRFSPFIREDSERLHALWTDPDVRRYLWDDEVISLQTAEEIVEASTASFETHGFGLWSLYPRRTSDLIGFCGFRFVGEDGEVELLYGLLPAYWGRGLATEAANAVLEFGFDKVGFEVVRAATDSPNDGSVRVLEKLGMKFEHRSPGPKFEQLHYSISKRHFVSSQRSTSSGNSKEDK